MIFNIITIFPKILDSYFSESILKRAQSKKLIYIKTHNLRDFTLDKHHKVDDTPYGGGPGMVFKADVIDRAVNKIIRQPANKNKKIKSRTILFSLRGKKFNSKVAKRLSKYDQLILICGRYEGVDERVAEYVADEEISIGDFVLSGGELAAGVLVDAVSRFIPGVLGKLESLEEIKGSYPVYTKPEFVSIAGKNRTVPSILLSGNHKKIDEWRIKHK
ncbi:MAG: tRNA (guanosine(37)-N1)-methyltransferase TrmD [Patescibacteria group bacterium]|nr:tRNA (guanosine(37)-N1)-methyltransferase TrmD [Patescibacteria group bacterium]